LTSRLSSDVRRAAALRVVVVGAAMVAMLAVLIGRLWWVQVLRGPDRREESAKQSIRRVRLPGVRGTVFDRHGECLAGNRPSYCVGIYLEEVRQPGKWERTIQAVDALVNDLARVLGRPRVVDIEDIRRHVVQRLPLPFIAWRDLSPLELVRFEMANHRFRGVDITVEPVRTYSRGTLAPHLIGYVQRVAVSEDPEEEEEGEEDYKKFYLPDLQGLCGVERYFDSMLSGQAGATLISVDAAGYKHSKAPGRHRNPTQPQPGTSLMLTLDARVQRIAEDVVAGTNGAVVVLDPNNGDVLAMASSPGYDLSRFTPSVSAAEMDRLVRDPARPFVNRAVGGRYAPGSVFKPVVAMAALENPRVGVTPDTTFDCPGYFEIGGLRFDCWNYRGHHILAMRKAVEQSCNAYFCQIGLKCGHERIGRMAEAMGVGEKTGVELTEEIAGLLPDNDWKRRRFGDDWRPGDTCNLAIGQGFLLVTPIQMAAITATFANGGWVYRPRLLMRDLGRLANPYDAAAVFAGHPSPPAAPLKSMNWNRRNLDAVCGGMHDVVQAENGTGTRAAVAGLEIGGKTGTAEYGTGENRRKYAWMIAYAPFDRPRYAVALVLENALAGGRDAGPRIRTLFSRILELERERAQAAGEGNRG
jgi:penicillin-binding protein 2